METLMYLAKVGIIYTVFYLIYYTLFRNNTNYHANRIYLLLILPFSYILPILNSSVEVATQFQINLPVIEVGNTTPVVTAFNWGNLILYFYVAVSALVLVLFFINIFKTLLAISKIKKGVNKEMPPFSFFSFVYVPEKIKNEDRNAIIYHEQIHCYQVHSLDIIIYEISKVLLWWNPFLWMGLISVKSNHEFIADKLASEKADKYSSVLVAQLFGVNCSALANNFNYEPLIKRRIMMMKTKKSNRLSVLKYALVLPVILVTLVASTNKGDSIPAVPSPPTPPAAPALEEIAIINQDQKVYDEVDVMPEFKGGMKALMKHIQSNVKYPSESRKNGISGKVRVGFVIDFRGDIKDVKVKNAIDPLLDKEAMRVIKAMPKWTPGKHKGKKVNVAFTIPIMFKLDNKK
jgi:TonB family protein